MKLRALKIKLLNGLEALIPFAPTNLSTVDSASEVIEIISRMKPGIRKFNDRNPDIKWIPKTRRSDLSLENVLFELLNSRKFIHFPIVDESKYQEIYKLDFTTETLLLSKRMNSDGVREELGTLHINSIFSNWKELFYSDIVEEKSILEKFEEVDARMVKRLEPSLYKLWKQAVLSITSLGIIDVLPDHHMTCITKYSDIIPKSPDPGIKTNITTGKYDMITKTFADPMTISGDDYAKLNELSDAVVLELYPTFHSDLGSGIISCDLIIDITNESISVRAIKRVIFNETLINVVDFPIPEEVVTEVESKLDDAVDEGLPFKLSIDDTPTSWVTYDDSLDEHSLPKSLDVPTDSLDIGF